MRLKKASSNADTVSFAAKSASQKKWDEVFVERWVDYSSKYGLAYLLTNGTVGINFKDSSVIVSKLGSTTFTFVDSKHTNCEVEYQFSSCDQTLSGEL